ncbi:hypothetical protein [Cryobacterium sp. PH31-L1]|uniref:hypothetical protein n=1 Tax=Cryobacterium sp. PH31-L1 TaxID=3046199 RepID=UPI0024B969AE|nr:hypothetical protein [Cryobacterium sp. PH31-L1]MDJ0376450.1 hypothetical protein [Cryobacterium sp. PH31-L1]
MTVTCVMMVSEDGYAAGVNQSLQHPLGEGGDRLARWRFERPDENAAEIAAIATAVLRAGEPLLAGLDDLKLEKLSSVERQLVTHVTYRVAR